MELLEVLAFREKRETKTQSPQGEPLADPPQTEADPSDISPEVRVEVDS